MFQMICSLISLVCTTYLFIIIIKNNKRIVQLREENIKLKNKIVQLENKLS